MRAARRHRKSRLYPRAKVLLRRRWLAHAVLVAGTSAAGGTSGDDPVDTLRPVRRAALPHESQGPAAARGPRAGLRSLHHGNPGNAIRQRTEAVCIRVTGGLGSQPAAEEVPAGEREETVRGGVRERPRCRARSPWRSLPSRMPGAWPASQGSGKDGNGGNADAGLPAAGSGEGPSASQPPVRFASRPCRLSSSIPWLRPAAPAAPARAVAPPARRPSPRGPAACPARKSG